MRLFSLSVFNRSPVHDALNGVTLFSLLTRYIDETIPAAAVEPVCEFLLDLSTTF